MQLCALIIKINYVKHYLIKFIFERNVTFYSYVMNISLE